MKVYGKDNGLWREVIRAMLAGLLCLPFYSAIAESITPVTGGKMETVNSIPEGYRPLPVTEFVVDVEKNDTYTVIVGVEFPGKPSDAQEWLEKNFTGRIDIYKKNSLEPIYSYFVFNKKNSYPSAGASGIISDKTFWGEQFSVKLEKDDYIISPKLYVVDDSFKYTSPVYIFFKRVRSIWW